jgi:hypothetical protein
MRRRFVNLPRWAIGVCIVMLPSGALAQAADVTIPVNPKTPAEHTLDEAVPDAQGIHRLAILRGLDKITGRAVDISAPVGVPVTYGSLSITVEYCHTVPPEEPPETSAFLQIIDKGAEGGPKPVFSGWMFASSPALNALEHPIYDVWVITCKTDEPAPEPEAPATAPMPAPAETPAAPSSE